MLLLLIIALILAWPTYGFSLIAYLALVFGRTYFSTKIQKRRANTLSAIREVQAGKGHPPSWVNDSTQSSAFIGATISEATRKGVPQSFIANHFKSNENKAALLCVVGLMEDKGSSIREQGIAATDFICDVWKIQSSLVSTKMTELEVLLTDARVHYEISSLLEHGTMFHGDEEVAGMLEQCLEAADEVRAITGQTPREVLSIAIGNPQPA